MARGLWPIRKPCMLRFRMPISATAVFLRCSSSVSPNVSNRRVRTRTHGGVAGVGGRPPPLCRSNRVPFTWPDTEFAISHLRQNDFTTTNDNGLMLSMIFKGVAGVFFVELPIFDDCDIFHSIVDAPGACVSFFPASKG